MRAVQLRTCPSRASKRRANGSNLSEAEISGGDGVGLDLIRRYRSERRKILDRLREQRREVRVESAARWAVRYAVCVCSASMLVLNGYLAHHVAHGYGVWAVVTAVNCSERTQGGMLRKSFERALGTIVGCTSAIGVLYVDDFIVPEAYGWSLRAMFLYVCVLCFTAITVYLRSINKRENFDYFYLLATLSFDYLLLSAFADADVNEEPLHRIYMVALGGFLTVLTSIFVFPTYSGDELRSTCATNLDRVATMVEELGINMVEVCSKPGVSQREENGVLEQEYKAVMSSSSFEATMMNLARFDLRSFVEPGWGEGKWSGWRLSVNMPWQYYMNLGEGTRSLATACHTIEVLLKRSALDGGLLVQGVDFELEILSVTRLFSQVLQDLATVVSGNNQKKVEDVELSRLIRGNAMLQEKAERVLRQHNLNGMKSAIDASTLITLLGSMEDNLTNVYNAVQKLEQEGFFDVKPGFFTVLSEPR